MSDQDIEQTVIGYGNLTTGTGNININAPAPIRPEDRDSLLLLLDRVEAFWIKDVLEGSVASTSLIPISKTLQPNVVAHPWEDAVEIPSKAKQGLASDLQIVDLYEKARALLILGNPGYGKTMALLELARDLIERHRKGLLQACPVVFTLSTWGEKSQSFDSWLLRELSTRYGFPKEQGLSWIKSYRLLLLLDGFDQVRADRREACLSAIHHFIQTFGIPGIVVCSRTEEYQALPSQFRFNSAIELQPLALEKIHEYLTKAGAQLNALRSMLRGDLVLQQVVQTPLMLSIAVSVYENLEGADIADAAEAEARRKLLFEAYINRMFKHKVIAKRLYSKNQTLYWLQWLAQKMAEHSQSELLIEQLQPSWLSTRLQRIIYVLFSRAVSGFIPGLVYGFVLALTYDSSLGIRWAGALGLLGAAATVLVDVGKFEARKKLLPEGTLACLVYRVLNTYPYGLAAIVLYLVSGALLPSAATMLPAIVSEGLLWILLWGATLEILFGRRDGRATPKEDIQPTERLKWSAKGALKVGTQWFKLGLIAGVLWWAYWSLLFPQEMKPIEWIPDAVVCSLGVGLLGAVLGGLTRVAYKGKTFPNQGMRLSRTSAVFAGLQGGVIIGSFIGFTQWLFMGSKAWLYLRVYDGFFWGLRDGFVVGVFSGFFIGVLIALGYGGLTLVQHFSLRVLLYIKGYLPYNVAHFLEHATSLILLRRVGSGYTFIHPLFLEYFATRQGTKKS